MTFSLKIILRGFIMNIGIAKILAAGLGGFIGAALRYMLTAATTKSFGGFPVGTLIVNAAGGLIMGFIMEISTVYPLSETARVFLTTGVLGGLTTFSTFTFETVSFISEGRYLTGGLNAGLNLFSSLLACFAGKVIARLI